MSREIRLCRVQSGGRHIYEIRIPYGDRRYLEIEVEVHEEETSEGPEGTKSVELTAAVPVLEEALLCVKQEVGP